MWNQYPWFVLQFWPSVVLSSLTICQLHCTFFWMVLVCPQNQNKMKQQQLLSLGEIFLHCRFFKELLFSVGHLKWVQFPFVEGLQPWESQDCQACYSILWLAPKLISLFFGTYNILHTVDVLYQKLGEHLFSGSNN